MKIKLDENLPASLAPALELKEFDVDTIEEEGLVGRIDQDVFQAAQAAGRFFITQDLDFSDTRRYRPGAHPGILLLRLRVPGRLALTQRVLSLFDREDALTWAGCFVVATDWRLRIVRPKG